MVVMVSFVPLFYRFGGYVKALFLNNLFIQPGKNEGERGGFFCRQSSAFQHRCVTHLYGRA
ncbi:MAG TPA: hypothetical protein VF610_01530 [Segetibacter sp.]|jgi:hypothetical protein